VQPKALHERRFEGIDMCPASYQEVREAPILVGSVRRCRNGMPRQRGLDFSRGSLQLSAEGFERPRVDEHASLGKVWIALFNEARKCVHPVSAEKDRELGQIFGGMLGDQCEEPERKGLVAAAPQVKSPGLLDGGDGLAPEEERRVGLLGEDAPREVFEFILDAEVQSEHLTLRGDHEPTPRALYLCEIGLVERVGLRDEEEHVPVGREHLEPTHA
jgi:hypothetical protein